MPSTRYVEILLSEQAATLLVKKKTKRAILERRRRRFSLSLFFDLFCHHHLFAPPPPKDRVGAPDGFFPQFGAPLVNLRRAKPLCLLTNKRPPREALRFSAFFFSSSPSRGFSRRGVFRGGGEEWRSELWGLPRFFKGPFIRVSGKERKRKEKRDHSPGSFFHSPTFPERRATFFFVLLVFSEEKEKDKNPRKMLTFFFFSFTRHRPSLFSLLFSCLFSAGRSFSIKSLDSLSKRTEQWTTATTSIRIRQLLLRRRR